MREVSKPLGKKIRSEPIVVMESLSIYMRLYQTCSTQIHHKFANCDNSRKFRQLGLSKATVWGRPRSTLTTQHLPSRPSAESPPKTIQPFITSGCKNDFTCPRQFFSGSRRRVAKLVWVGSVSLAVRQELGALVPSNGVRRTNPPKQFGRFGNHLIFRHEFRLSIQLPSSPVQPYRIRVRICPFKS